MIFSDGRECGPFMIVRRISEGPLLQTYAALDPRTNDAVEITCASYTRTELRPPEPSVFNEQLERLRSLDYPGQPRALDGGISPEGVYWVAVESVEMAIPVLDARSFFLAHKTHLVAQMTAWVVEVARILDDAATRGVLHGDLTPDALWLTPGNEAFLKRLGFVQLFGLDHAAALATPRYRSPEQLEGEPIDVRSDVYSGGMVLYQLLIGKPPFGDAPLAELLTLALHATPEPLSEADCPRVLADVLVKATRKRPLLRFPTWASFIDGLVPLVYRLAERLAASGEIASLNRSQPAKPSTQAPAQSTGSKDAATPRHEDLPPRTVRRGPVSERMLALALTEAARKTYPEQVRAGQRRAAPPPTLGEPEAAASLARPEPPRSETPPKPAMLAPPDANAPLDPATPARRFVQQPEPQSTPDQDPGLPPASRHSRRVDSAMTFPPITSRPPERITLPSPTSRARRRRRGGTVLALVLASLACVLAAARLVVPQPIRLTATPSLGVPCPVSALFRPDCAPAKEPNAPVIAPKAAPPPPAPKPRAATLGAKHAEPEPEPEPKKPWAKGCDSWAKCGVTKELLHQQRHRVSP